MKSKQMTLKGLRFQFSIGNRGVAEQAWMFWFGLVWFRFMQIICRMFFPYCFFPLSTFRSLHKLSLFAHLLNVEESDKESVEEAFIICICNNALLMVSGIPCCV